MFSGVGAGGAVLPFIIQLLLHRFTYRTTLISFGLVYFLIGLACISQIKPRIPVSKKQSTANSSRKLDRKFLKRSPFYAFMFCVLLTSLGNFIPSVWITC